MFEKVVDYIKENKMILPGDGVVVGFSGGADSTALLHILYRLTEKLSFKIFAVHINHGLRGEQAREDADFCMSFCKQYNIPFYLKVTDIKSLSAGLSISVEEAGREFRYRYFNEVLKITGSNKIATAHHKNDQAETILFNIIRGTGIQGLGGIKPVRDGLVIRPLLCVSRSEIEKYLKDNRLDYRTDYTNDDMVYTRNHVRHQLIPYIEKHFNPSFIETIDRLGQVAREEDDFFYEYCSKLVPKYFNILYNKVEVSLDFLDNHPAVRKRLVRLGIGMLKSSLKDISSRHIDDVIRLAMFSKSGSKLMLPNGVCILKNYKTIDILPADYLCRIEPFEIDIPVPGTVSVPALNIAAEVTQSRKDSIKNNLRADPFCVYIDKDAVIGKLRIRSRKEGDRFVPFGLKGSKKLKDYFIDKKVPRNERDRVPLVVDDANIIWVVGYQISDFYKVSRTTDEVLKIKVKYLKTEDYDERD